MFALAHAGPPARCRSVGCLLTAVLALLAVIPAAGQCEYDVTVLPCLYVGDYPLCPTPTGMNNVGQIVGYIDAVGGESARGFVWSEKDGLVLLPNPPGDVICRPYDINDAGTIVGTMGGFWTPFQAFIWDGNQYTGLSIPAGGTYSEAFAINEDGVVVGIWGHQGTGDPASSAFVWQDGVMTDLGPRLGTDNSYASDINNAGQITGWRGADILQSLGFRLDGETTTTLPPSPNAVTSWGEAINESGNICGRGAAGHPSESDFRWRGFSWFHQTMWPLLSYGSGPHSFGTGINDDGLVVGYSYDDPSRAFIWRDGAQLPLNDLVPVGVRALSAAAVDRGGRIAATATISAIGFYGGALLTPVLIPGDTNADCRVDLRDLLAALRSLGQLGLELPSDLDTNGVVDILDIAIIMAHWST